MKTWQQFTEDAQSYARDKEAYEKQTAASDRLESRRSAAKKKMRSAAKEFTKRSQQSSADIKSKAAEKRAEYDDDTSYSDKVQQIEKAKRRQSVKQGAAMFDAGVDAVRGAARRIRNRN